jgi:hypothetical protein
MAATRVAVVPMKVAQIPKAGADFQVVEREIPKPGVGQVRIRVQACSRWHDPERGSLREDCHPRRRDDLHGRPECFD